MASSPSTSPLISPDAPANGTVRRCRSPAAAMGMPPTIQTLEFVFIDHAKHWFCGPTNGQRRNAAIYLLNVNPLTVAGPTTTMSCSGLPTAATCFRAVPRCLPELAVWRVTLTINTTVRTAGVTDLRTGPRNDKLLVHVASTDYNGTGGHQPTPSSGAGWEGLNRRWLLGGLLLLAALSGCGGGGGSSTAAIVHNPQGTPAGTYTITVSATSPNANASTPVTLIVK